MLMENPILEFKVEENTINVEPAHIAIEDRGKFRD
jgi:hypothetical protein